jgi:hypothetical protein
MPTQLQSEIQVQQTEHQIKLTSAEIANLWSSYQNDSLAVCNDTKSVRSNLAHGI